MRPSPASAEQRWWVRHAWITVTACGLLGALIFFASPADDVGRAVGQEAGSPLGAPLPGVGLIMATMAGFLLGFWEGCC